MIMKRHCSSAIAIVALLSACGGGGGGTTSPPPPAKTLGSITVTAATVSVAAGESATITANAFDTGNAALGGVTFTYASSNANVAEVSGSGSVLALGAGTSTITVTGLLTGVTKTATVAVTVTGTLPATANVVGGSGGNIFAPATVVIATGGSVGWTWGAVTHNVTFDAATGAPTNIPSAASVAASKVFPTAGNFAYQCTIHAGMTGRVVVR